MATSVEPTVAGLQAQLEHRTRQLADARRQFSEEIGPLLRLAKKQAWDACSNAHIEFSVMGDAGVLDNPYLEEAGQ